MGHQEGSKSVDFEGDHDAVWSGRLVLCVRHDEAQDKRVCPYSPMMAEMSSARARDCPRSSLTVPRVCSERPQ